MTHGTELPVGTALDLNGVHFTRGGESERSWLYRPAAVGLDETVSGAPQFALIEAGPLAMLSLTTVLVVSEMQLQAGRTALATRLGCRPEQLTLSTQEIQVGEVVLQIGDGAGTLAPVAATTSSGTAGYSAAFSLSLTPGQLAAVKRAVAGDCGWLAACYTVTELPQQKAGRSSTFSSAEYSSTTTITTTGGKSDTATANSSTTESSGRADPAEPPTPRTIQVQTDACEWSLQAI